MKYVFRLIINIGRLGWVGLRAETGEHIIITYGYIRLDHMIRLIVYIHAYRDWQNVILN